MRPGPVSSLEDRPVPSAAMTGPVRSPGAKLQRQGIGKLLVLVLCWIQGLLALIAAVVVWAKVEYVIGFGPAICLGGLLICLVAIYRISLQLLLFGLASSLVTSGIAFVISAFTLSPGEAAIPVATIVGVYTLVVLAWNLLTTVQFSRSSMLTNFKPAATRLRFSIRSLLVATTAVCVVAAMMRQLELRGEFIFFATYGFAVVALCIVLALTFRWRVSQHLSDCLQDQTTVKETDSRPTGEHKAPPLPSSWKK